MGLTNYGFTPDLTILFLLLGYVVKGPYMPKQLEWFSPLKIYICIAAHISSWTITDQLLQLNRLKGLHIRVYGYHGGGHRLLARVESCSHRAYPPRPCVTWLTIQWNWWHVIPHLTSSRHFPIWTGHPQVCFLLAALDSGSKRGSITWDPLLWCPWAQIGKV